MIKIKINPPKLRQPIECQEDDNPFTAKWININEFIQGEKILYPEGIVEYLVSV